MAFTTVAFDQFVIEHGAGRLGRHASTPFGERCFCIDCGSPLTIHVSHQANEIDIAVGSLDDPALVAPGFHLFAKQARPWMLPDDGLPRYDGLRPETRGLRQGQTEL